MDCWLMVDLKYNFECDSLNELSDNKIVLKQTVQERTYL